MPLRFSVGSVVTPGDRLGSIREILPGRGCYTKGGHVYSSAVGCLRLLDNNDNHREAVVEPSRPWPIVLAVGQLVVCQVERLVLQQAVVKIVLLIILNDDNNDDGETNNNKNNNDDTTTTTGSTIRLQHFPEGCIRREDVRQNTRDELKLETCFQPGDWVLARVVSLGDSRRYFLSTAETELGVMRAQSRASGEIMRPTSWKEMECPKTGKKEARKCARPTEALQKVISSQG